MSGSLVIRHYSSREAHSESWWRYEPSRKMIVIIVRKRTMVCIDVCSPLRPRFGAFPIHKYDVTTWRIPPERYTNRIPNGALVTVPRQPHFMIGEQLITLTDAPIHVSQYIAELSDPWLPPSSGAP